LDDLLPDVGPVALLKLDVEGYEGFVLRGAAALLRRTECVHFESWQPLFARYGFACSDVFAELTARGFTLYRLHPPAVVAVPAGDVSTRCENLVAVRDVQALLRRTGYRLAGGVSGAEPAGGRAASTT
jgi:hypothetical protein